MHSQVRETEAAYISDLQTVLSVYVRPAIERRMLTLDDTLAIFANLEELCRCATVLDECPHPVQQTVPPRADGPPLRACSCTCTCVRAFAGARRCCTS